MIVSSEALPDHAPVRADVCIIGAGAAGITLACELSKCQLSIVLLEAAGTGRWTSQDPYGGTSEGAHPSPLSFRRRAFGGSTTIWGGRCVPYDPIDFERRDYVARSGWPIGYDDVARYYPAALDYCDAGAFEFRTIEALPGARPTIPGGFSDDEILTDRIERYSLPTDFGARYRKRLESRRNMTVITNAHVTRLEKDEAGDRIAAVKFFRRDSRVGRVEATVFVLATGGIETPRVLLASDPCGIGFGNNSDCVGRYYNCHLENVVGVVRPKGPGLVFDFEITRDGVYCRRKFQVNSAAQQRERLLNIAFRLHYPDVSDPDHKSAVLSAVYLAKRTVIPEYRRILQHGNTDSTRGDTLVAHLSNVVVGLPQLLAFSADWLKRRVLARRKLPYVLVANPDGSFPIEFNSEQSPLADSRIVLGEQRDRWGMQRVHIRWRICDDDIQSVCRAYGLLKRRLDASGRCTVEFDEVALRSRVSSSRPIGGHHIGTARMAGSRSNGVVDSDCAVFDLPNLFVAGSAIFPTSSHANPTLTIVAMSIRLASHLRTTLGA